MKILSKNTFFETKNQYFVTFLANLLALGQGFSVGWISPTLQYLQSNESPLLSGQLSLSESSWIVALTPFGGMFGTLFFGGLTKYVGSKNANAWCVIPIVINWFIIKFAEYSWQLCVARFFLGVTGGGIFICIPLFVPEIASDNIRGALGSMLTISTNVGILLGYIGGTYLHYNVMPYFALICPAIFLCTFTFMPSSPQWLLRNNKILEAKKSLEFYRNFKNASKNDQDKIIKEYEDLKAIATANTTADPLQISDFLEPVALKSFLTCVCLVIIVQFTGVNTIINYAATIFKETGSTFDPKLSGIVLGCLQVSGTICALSLIDRVGRKVLLFISTFGCGLGLAATGIYSYLISGGYDLSKFNWVPVVSLPFAIFIASIGISPVPYVVMAEILPQKIRTAGSIVCVIIVSLAAFISMKILPILLFYLNLYGVICIYVTGCILGNLFTIFILKETKGKHLDTVESARH